MSEVKGTVFGSSMVARPFAEMKFELTDQEKALAADLKARIRGRVVAPLKHE